MALRHLLLIEPKLLLIGAVVLLSALVFTLLLDVGTASADCVTIKTLDYNDKICSPASLWDEVSIWHQMVYSWHYYFG
ncbi:MAG: hypothetical protein O7A71_00435 [Chloroflexi bacterium]|nr:hypothetical protein [Chloroflexota bacterium]